MWSEIAEYTFNKNNSVGGISLHAFETTSPGGYLAQVLGNWIPSYTSMYKYYSIFTYYFFEIFFWGGLIMMRE